MTDSTHVLCSIDMTGVEKSTLNVTRLWPPLVKNRDFRNGLRTLYQNRTLSASLHDEGRYTVEGIRLEKPEDTIAYERVIAFLYSVKESRLDLLDSLEIPGIPNTGAGYNPSKRILSARENCPYRYLIR